MENTKLIVPKKPDYSFMYEGVGVLNLLTFVPARTREDCTPVAIKDTLPNGEEVVSNRYAYTRDYNIKGIVKRERNGRLIPLTGEEFGAGLTLTADTVSQIQSFDENTQSVLAALLLNLSAQSEEERKQGIVSIYVPVFQTQKKLAKAQQVTEIIKNGISTLKNVWFSYVFENGKKTISSRFISTIYPPSNGLYPVRLDSTFLDFACSKLNQNKAYFPTPVLSLANQTRGNFYRVAMQLWANFRTNQKNGYKRSHTAAVKTLYESSGLPSLEEVRASKGRGVYQRTVGALINILDYLMNMGILGYWYFIDGTDNKVNHCDICKLKAEEWLKLNIFYELQDYPKTDQTEEEKA